MNAKNKQNELCASSNYHVQFVVRFEVEMKKLLLLLLLLYNDKRNNSQHHMLSRFCSHLCLFCRIRTTREILLKAKARNRKQFIWKSEHVSSEHSER